MSNSFVYNLCIFFFIYFAIVNHFLFKAGADISTD